MGDTTPLTLPPDLPYPITITRVVAAAKDSVRRGDKMFEYTFMSATRRADIAKAEKAGKVLPKEFLTNDMVGSWESPIAGELVSWMPDIKVGMKIERQRGTKTIVRIEQPCTHPVQFNGMCGVCGADLTNDDYLSRPAEESEAGPSRYPGSFELAHDASGVTVSTDEAKRLETMSRDNLLANRKLSLIVDLDQTIIHTTVDPTVGKWMDECEEDEKEQGDTTEPMDQDDDGSTTPTGSPSTSKSALKREKNPNAEALKDVARFLLPDDLPPGAIRRGQAPPMRAYYTKPRPGLKEFLAKQSQLYEMHVYTMGTRTYADAICKIVDPDGSIFGGRILSRDESGSMKTKSLMRLFPTDQSMVVIIDDRSDVWGDCPNLVKVVPYDFFIGIGDINGAFLPPTQPTISAMPGQPPTPSATSASSAASSPGPETPTDIPSTEDGLLRQSKILDEMANSRPLEQLEHESSDCEETAEENATQEVESKSDTSDSSEEHHHHRSRKALLNPNDEELIRVGDILTRIHNDYYEAYDDRDPASANLPMACDTPLLIQEMKDQVLQGCTIAFTGVIPRNVRPEDSEIWRMTEEFGAVCSLDLNPRVTHLVTSNPGTEKMHHASKMPKIKTVWLAWLQTSIALWKHEAEGPYLVQQASQTAEASRPDSPVPAVPEPAPEEAGEEDWDDGDFEKWLDEDSGSEEGEDGKPKVAVEGATDDGSDDDDVIHRWSRASTPARGILSRAGSRAGSRSPSPGPARHVRYADEENLPLERVREPRPGELVSYPPQKKRKLSPLLLGAPTEDDDVPEANRMVFQGSVPAANGSTTPESDEGSDTATEGDDEFAQMLSDSLA